MVAQTRGSYLAGSHFKVCLHKTVSSEMAEPTFVFENNRAYALVDGQVVASADSVDELEKVAYGDDVSWGQSEPDVSADPPQATHVETPNGLQGQILGRVKDMWGETVTVRFANGTIKQLPVSKELTFTAEKEEKKEKPAERFKKKLEEGKDDLKERKDDLEEVKKDASRHIANGVSHADGQELHSIIVQADYELEEVNDAIAYQDSDEAEAFEPPAPFAPHVMEQESVGGSSSDWLDQTVEQMVAEAENVDYAKLLDEGPEAFAAELDDPVLVDGGSVRQMASSFIRTKTATANADIRDKYETAWLARVEQCRRQELATRKQTVHKQAAAEKQQFENVSDESLFL